jgi:SAM-dependent methyltransferase
MFHVPSVDEWWRLTEKYPQFRSPSHNTLKDYGYMRLFEYIEQNNPKRILEFGHGFGPILFNYCEQHNIEVWGVDDHMDLWYFPPRDMWMENHNTVFGHLKNAKMILGQLGTQEKTRQELPHDYFDMVCSVSVLEELGDNAIIAAIIRHARDLLRTGGVFMNTHDMIYTDPMERRQLILDLHKEAGLPIYLAGQEHLVLNQLPAYIDLSKCLLENPTIARVFYNAGDPDNYFGHWSTLLLAAHKS